VDAKVWFFIEKLQYIREFCGLSVNQRSAFSGQLSAVSYKLKRLTARLHDCITALLNDN